jgi:F-type H+-transporting ATPase subunit b
MFSLVVVPAAFVPTIVDAAGGGHSESAPADQWLVFVFSSINFVIFALLFRRFAAAPLRDFLARRRTEVAEAIESASLAKAEAEALKAEYEAKAAKLDETKKELIAEVRAVAEVERGRAITAANESAQRMRQEADRIAQSDLERARRELRGEAARLATELASELISNRLDDAERKRLVDDFVEKVQVS